MFWRALTGTLWLGLLMCTQASAGCSRETEYRRFDSPDGAYHVSVYRRSVAAAMPGQSGDAPGTVRLHDKAGRVLQEAEVDMVQRVDRVEWDGNTVHVKLVADWPLHE
jgi:hypothetical protein